MLALLFEVTAPLIDANTASESGAKVQNVKASSHVIRFCVTPGYANCCNSGFFLLIIKFPGLNAASFNGLPQTDVPLAKDLLAHACSPVWMQD
jgi:hypothetical protein